MTAAIASERKPKSGIPSVIAGVVFIFIASFAVDEVLHLLGVYPPWGEHMPENALNALALSYRLVFDVIGAYITARLASHAPMKYAMILGYVGLVLSALGVIGGIVVKAGPLWYPIALFVSAVPSAWLGGMLYVRERH